MRVLILAVALGAMALAGCGTSPVSTPVADAPSQPVISVPNIDTDAVVSNIEKVTSVVTSITKGACAVAPTGLTVAGIFSSNPNIQTAAQAAAVICGFVNGTGASKLMGARRGAGPRRLGTYRGPRGQVSVDVVPAR